MDSDTVNKRNLIKQVSLIFYSPFTTKNSEVLYIGIIEKEKKVIITLSRKSGYYRLKGVSRRQGYGT